MSLNRIVESYAEWILRYRWFVIIAAVAICAAIGAGAMHLRTTPDNRVFFGPANPDLKAFETLEATYRENNDVLIAVSGDTGEMFTAERLDLLRRMTDELWTKPYVSRIDSLANYQYSEANGDELIVRDLVARNAVLDRENIDRIRDFSLSEPALTGLLVSRDGEVAGIAANFQLNAENPEAIRSLVAALRAFRAEVEAENPDINIHMTGNIMLMSAFDEASQQDLKTLAPLMLVAIAILMTAMFRSFAAVSAIILLAALSSGVAMGAAGWNGVVINAGSSSAPLVIFTIALAYGVHMATKFLSDYGVGWSKEEAIGNALEFNLAPIVLTSLTSAIGFLSMNGSDAPPFHDLGNIVATGVTAALILSFTFLPAYLSVVKISKPKKRVRGQRLLMWLGSVVVSRRRAVFWSMLLVIVGLGSGISRIELNDDWIGYFDERYEFNRDTNFILENLTGIDILEYSVPSEGEDGIFEPSYLEHLEAFTDWLRGQPDVVNVQSLSDVMKRLNRDLNEGDAAAYALPENRELAAQYLLLYELSLPFGLDLNDRIVVDRSATRVTVILNRDGKNLPSKELQPLAKRIDGWLAENSVSEPPAKGTGLSLMFAYLSENNIRAMIFSTGLALLLISGILVFALRSIPIGVASLVPNFVPAIMGFGFWGFTVGEAGVPVSVVGAMTFGIVVDDTIHFLSKYLRGRRELGKTPQEAILYAFRSVGTALTVTTLVLVVGFSVLAMSGFKVTSTLGMLTAIVLGFALIADFLFLPSLLLQFDRTTKDVAGDVKILRNATPFTELPALTARVDKYLERIENGHPLRGKPPGDGAIELWSNDYLSLAGHPKIVRSQIDALQAGRNAVWGASSTFDIEALRREVEDDLANLIGVQDLVLCQSGWCANVDLLRLLGDPQTPIYLDISVHASLWDGARASGAPIRTFRHNRPESFVKQAERYGPGIVVMDAVYSADGTVCPLQEMIGAAERHECVTVVDESHSIGVYGDRGEGLIASLGLTERSHYCTASLSKAFATRAGFVGGPARVMEHFRNLAPSMTHSAPLMPQEIACLSATLEVIKREKWRRDRMWKNARFLRRRLSELGYNVDDTNSQVIALEAGPESRSMQLRDALEDRDIFGAVFCAPATPQNRSLLRLSVNCALDDEALERIVETCRDIRESVELDQWPSTKRKRMRNANHGQHASEKPLQAAS
ncbi:MAG: alpha-hydroxyketone-type quorum-sensing autoinducer synthase [Pseudomonadota bacterium]